MISIEMLSRVACARRLYRDEDVLSILATRSLAPAALFLEPPASGCPSTPCHRRLVPCLYVR